MIEIVVATKNAGKVKEFADALSHLPVQVVDLSEFGDIPEAVEDGDSFAENAELKARHYVRYTGKACLADDSGLEVDALDGAPGVYSARYAGEYASDAENNKKLLTSLNETEEQARTARFRCALALVTSDGIITADGACEGIILNDARGNGGFGYDPLFYMPEMGKTLAEMTVAEKNKVSHRGQAIKKMAEKLAGYLK